MLGILIYITIGFIYFMFLDHIVKDSRTNNPEVLGKFSNIGIEIIIIMMAISWPITIIFLLFKENPEDK